MSEKFCAELIEECEYYGRWSDGNHEVFKMLKDCFTYFFRRKKCKMKLISVKSLILVKNIVLNLLKKNILGWGKTLRTL